jgi:hypothetical protein
MSEPSVGATTRKSVRATSGRRDPISGGGGEPVARAVAHRTHRQHDGHLDEHADDGRASPRDSGPTSAIAVATASSKKWLAPIGAPGAATPDSTPNGRMSPYVSDELN